MRAILRHARISPKKANLIAGMVRAMPAVEALAVLDKLPKKGAKIVSGVIASAVANAEHNASQNRKDLVIRTLSVNQGRAFRRFIPIARGRARAIDKFTCHILVELGIDAPEEEKKGKKKDAKTSKAEKGEKGKRSEKGKKGEKGKKDEKKEDDIVYSESKPVEDVPQKKEEGEGDQSFDSAQDKNATKAADQGGAQFQGQRKGSRGS